LLLTKVTSSWRITASSTCKGCAY